MSEASKGNRCAGNKGYLFPNKKSNDSQPDFRGKANIDGKEWLVSGWKRNKDGEEMISFSFTDPADLPPRRDAGQRSGSASGASQSNPAPPPPSGSLGSIFDDLP